DKMPTLVSVQSAGCAPIVKACEEGKKESEVWDDSETIAFGINVPKALGDFLVLEAIYETKSRAVSIKDSDVSKEKESLSQKEGAFVCPEGAEAYFAARQLRDEGWIARDKKVVVLNTGAGIKYPDTVEVEVPTLEKGESIEPAEMK